MKVYYDKDADLAHLEGKTIAMIGYGSQGHAHALNLKDNGQNVVVGLYPESKSRAVAEAAGLRGVDVPEAAKEADVLMMVIPDHLQGRVYREQIEPNLRPGSAFMVVCQAISELMSELKNTGTTASMMDRMATLHQCFETVGLSHMLAQDAQYASLESATSG